jgi:hypothetical protein
VLHDGGQRATHPFERDAVEDLGAAVGQRQAPLAAVDLPDEVPLA